MVNQPTPKDIEDIEDIEHTQKYWDEKFKRQTVTPFVGEPSPFGRELIEDTIALLSIIPNQGFIETSLRDFHSHLADKIISKKY